MSEEVPQFVDLLCGEAEEFWSTPYGTTGRVFRDRDFEVVWFSNDQEEVDPSWFSQPDVHLLFVVKGN